MIGESVDTRARRVRRMAKELAALGLVAEHAAVAALGFILLAQDRSSDAGSSQRAARLHAEAALKIAELGAIVNESLSARGVEQPLVARVLSGIDYAVEPLKRDLRQKLLGAASEIVSGDVARADLAERLVRDLLPSTRDPEVMPRLINDLVVRAVSASAGGGDRGSVRVLDPACGNGLLLLAAASDQDIAGDRACVFMGIEVDMVAAATTQLALSIAGVNHVIECRDTLKAALPEADVIICAPPVAPFAPIRSRGSDAPKAGTADEWIGRLLDAAAATAVIVPAGFLRSSRFRGARMHIVDRRRLQAVITLPRGRSFAVVPMAILSFGREVADTVRFIDAEVALRGGGSNDMGIVDVHDLVDHTLGTESGRGWATIPAADVLQHSADGIDPVDFIDEELDASAAPVDLDELEQQLAQADVRAQIAVTQFSEAMEWLRRG